MKIIEERQSPINGKINVVRSFGLGTYIQVEGLTQSGGVVGTVWKQTLKKVSSIKSQVSKALILGLGGGTAAKLIKEFWPGAEITGVEIDPIMVELGNRHLRLGYSEVKVVVADALKYVSEIPDTRYDLIIVDTYIGDKVPPSLESENYIHLVRSHLSRSGVTVFNRLYYGEKRPEAVKFGENLKKVFSNVEYFYPEANLMFICRKN